MTHSSVVIEGFELKCRECNCNACAKRKFNGDSILWCPQCCAKATGREALVIVNALNDYGKALLEQEILPKEVQKRTKNRRAIEPQLKFYIERIVTTKPQ